MFCARRVILNLYQYFLQAIKTGWCTMVSLTRPCSYSGGSSANGGGRAMFPPNNYPAPRPFLGLGACQVPRPRHADPFLLTADPDRFKLLFLFRSHTTTTHPPSNPHVSVPTEAVCDATHRLAAVAARREGVVIRTLLVASQPLPPPPCPRTRHDG